MMLKHRQRFAAVQLHGELGGQLGKTRRTLQAVEDLTRQRPGIYQQITVDTCRGAEHQVAHIIAGSRGGPQPCVQQGTDQRSMLRANPSNLQVAPVSRLDHTTGIALANIGHRTRLCSRYRTTVQLDPTDTAIHRLDNAQ